MEEMEGLFHHQVDIIERRKAPFNKLTSELRLSLKNFWNQNWLKLLFFLCWLVSWLLFANSIIVTAKKGKKI
ncbi:hypothetical protein BpHYR1_000705 [Brachionus plicatilis]|uniref:Uncharacterized protein n=1 Tax=Brachionus plicatilis TaxID=10195 RepID=A0A3M7T5V4_BRAPC|nr:hypothetical protein BpHYR1_000705 [Brachionus plicatilis]